MAALPPGGTLICHQVALLEGKECYSVVSMSPHGRHSLLKGVYGVNNKHIYQQTNSISNSGQNTFLGVNISKINPSLYFRVI